MAALILLRADTRMAKTLRLELPDALEERLRALVDAGGFAHEEEVVRLALEELLGDRGSALQEQFQREDIAWASAQKAGTPLSPDGLRERERFVESVQAGLADAEAGRVITNEELGAKLDSLFGPLGTEGLKKRLRKDRPRTTIRRQPTHPGEILREDVLPALRLSVSEAARQLRVARQTLQRVLSGRSAVTPEMALRLGKLCGNGPDLWLRMQLAHDLWQARERLRAELDEIPEHAVR